MSQPPDAAAVRLPGARAFAHLGSASVAAAACGFAQNVVVVRAIGVEPYGLVGVLAATASVCTNVLDVRLADVVTRLYFRAADGRERRGVLAAGLAVQCAGAAVLVGLLAAALPLVLRAFPASPVGVPDVAWFCTAEAAAHVHHYLVYLIRMRERFGVLAGCQVVVPAVRACVIVAGVGAQPDLHGLLRAYAAAGIAGAAIAGALAAAVWRGPQASVDAVAAGLRAMVRARGTLVAFNALSWTNLLHRAADVLVVGLLAGERQAGVYKLARVVTDALYMAFDVANKVCQPALMRMLAAGRLDNFRAAARAIVRVATAGVVVAFALEAVALRPALALLVGADAAVAAPAIMALTPPLAFVGGVYLWAWPLLLHGGGVGRFVAASAVAVAVLQYGVGAAVFVLGGRHDVVWFALGFAATYPAVYLALWPTLRVLWRGLPLEATAAVPLRLALRTAGTPER